MVRVYLRGPSTGTSTGGGSGSGNTSLSGYDRYIGTIGAAADAPANAIFPHYTEFPAANKYDWLQVVSNTTINGKNLLAGQEFVCGENNTSKATASKWELRQKLKNNALQVSNYFERIKHTQTKVIAPPNTKMPIPFSRLIAQAGEKIYHDSYRTEITNWFKSYNEGSAYIPVTINVNIVFESNPQGFRTCEVYLQEFYRDYTPGQKNPNESALLTGSPLNGAMHEGISGDLILSSAVAATAKGVTILEGSVVFRQEQRFSDFQNIVYMYVNHNAPIDLEILSVRFSVVTWEGGSNNYLD